MSSKSALGRFAGLLGSWALFVLGLGLTGIAVAGQWINYQDYQKLQRYGVIEKLLNERVAGRAVELDEAREKSGSSLIVTREKMARASKELGRSQSAGPFLGVPAAGVLPDGWFVEMARKNGLSVIRLGPGQAIDADTGRVAQQTGGGVWSWLGKSAGSRRVLTVKHGTIVELSGKLERELPAGTLIRAADTLVIPPVGTPQRAFSQVPSVMATPLAPAPRPAAEQPKEKPAGPAVAAASPKKTRVSRLREAGESMFGKAWSGK